MKTLYILKAQQRSTIAALFGVDTPTTDKFLVVHAAVINYKNVYIKLLIRTPLQTKIRNIVLTLYFNCGIAKDRRIIPSY